MLSDCCGPGKLDLYLELYTGAPAAARCRSLKHDSSARPLLGGCSVLYCMASPRARLLSLAAIRVVRVAVLKLLQGVIILSCDKFLCPSLDG